MKTLLLPELEEFVEPYLENEDSREDNWPQMTIREHYEQRKLIAQKRANGLAVGKKNIEEELRKCSNYKTRNGVHVLKHYKLFLGKLLVALPFTGL